MLPFFDRETLTAATTAVDYFSTAVDIGEVNAMVFSVKEYAKAGSSGATVQYTVQTSVDMREWVSCGSGSTLSSGLNTVTGLSRYVRVAINVTDNAGTPVWAMVTCQVHGKAVEQ